MRDIVTKIFDILFGQTGDLSSYEDSEKFDMSDVPDEYRYELKKYSKKIQKNPKSEGAYTKRGSLKLAIGNYNGAVEDLEMAIELNPKNVFNYSEAASALCYLGNHAKAVKYLDIAIDLNPNDPALYYDRSKARSKINDYSGSMKDMSQVYKLDPKYESSRKFIPDMEGHFE